MPDLVRDPANPPPRAEIYSSPRLRAHMEQLQVLRQTGQANFLLLGSNTVSGYLSNHTGGVVINEERRCHEGEEDNRPVQDASVAEPFTADLPVWTAFGTLHLGSGLRTSALVTESTDNFRLVLSRGLSWGRWYMDLGQFRFWKWSRKYRRGSRTRSFRQHKRPIRACTGAWSTNPYLETWPRHRWCRRSRNSFSSAPPVILPVVHLSR